MSAIRPDDEFMSIEDALQIVIDLAKRQASTWTDADEHRRHMTAIGVVTDMATNQFGDD